MQFEFEIHQLTEHSIRELSGSADCPPSLHGTLCSTVIIAALLGTSPPHIAPVRAPLINTLARSATKVRTPLPFLNASAIIAA